MLATSMRQPLCISVHCLTLNLLKVSVLSVQLGNLAFIKIYVIGFTAPGRNRTRDLPHTRRTRYLPGHCSCKLVFLITIHSFFFLGESQLNFQYIRKTYQKSFEYNKELSLMSLTLPVSLKSIKRVWPVTIFYFLDFLNAAYYKEKSFSCCGMFVEKVLCWFKMSAQ